MPRHAVAPNPLKSLITGAVRLPAGFIAAVIAARLPKIVVADASDRFVNQRRRDERFDIDQFYERPLGPRARKLKRETGPFEIFACRRRAARVLVRRRQRRRRRWWRWRWRWRRRWRWRWRWRWRCSRAIAADHAAIDGRSSVELSASRRGAIVYHDQRPRIGASDGAGGSQYLPVDRNTRGVRSGGDREFACGKASPIGELGRVAAVLDIEPV